MDIPPQVRSHPGSRRTSIGSGAGSPNSQSHMLSPLYNESPAPSRSASIISSAEGITTQTATQRFAIVPDETLIVHPDEIEQDDDLHNPDNLDQERDFRFWTRRGLVNVGGLGLVVLGILTLFIASPIVWVSLIPISSSTRRTAELT